jgi:hypothetical protein
MESLDDLRRLSPAELEDLYCRDESVEQPHGCWAGKLLCWLDSPESKNWFYRPALAAMFQYSPFGIDFDEKCWYFWSRNLKTGRFTASVGPSLWRPTQTVVLRYEVSRLPGPVKSLLYDEVKPISNRLCLGMGGINLSGRPGEIFIFGLERL